MFDDIVVDGILLYGLEKLQCLFFLVEIQGVFGLVGF